MSPAPPRPSSAARLLLALGLTAVVLLAARLPPTANFFERLDVLALDVGTRLRGAVAPPAALVLVRLDEPAIAAAGGWPIDRRAWARLVDRVAAAGARTIVIDAFFAADRVDGDEELAAAMRRHGSVVVARDLGAPAPGLSTEIAAAAAGIGHSALTLGPDGRLLGLPPFLDAGATPVPALALEAIRVDRRLPRAALTSDPTYGARLAGAPLAPASGRQFLLRSYGPTEALTLAEITALDGTARLKGRLVVLAVDAVAAGERFRTPFTASASGGEALATAIGNLLDGRTLRVADVGQPLGAAAILVAALVASFLLGRLDGRLSLLVAVTLVAVGLAFAQFLFVRYDLVLARAAPLAAFVTGALLIEAYRLVLVQRLERELAFQRRNLGRFFTPAVAERLARMDRVDQLDRGTEATVMFVDLVGFTGFSERTPPAEAMAALRGFLAQVEDAVFAEGGTLVSFLGDGALACFGVPEPSPAPQMQGLAAARQLVRAHRGPLPVSVGLHHGPVVTGNGGGARQFQFTILGDTVNTASRIEGLSRDLDAAIVASSAVVEPAQVRAPDLVRDLVAAPPQVLRGRTGRLELWYLPRGIDG